MKNILMWWQLSEGIVPELKPVPFARVLVEKKSNFIVRKK